MANVKECEKLRGNALTTLQGEIRELRKACEVEAPNTRLIANLVTSLDKALNKLIDSHVAYVMKMNSQLEEPRFTQFIERWVDAAKEVKAVAVDVIGVVDEERVPNFQQVTESLTEDRNWMAWVIET